MKNSNSIKLIDGVFEATDAKEIILSLINFKINFHQRRIFSEEERVGTYNEASFKRIEELKAAKEQVLEWVESAEENGQQLIVNSQVLIEMVDGRSRKTAARKAEAMIA